MRKVNLPRNIMPHCLGHTVRNRGNRSPLFHATDTTQRRPDNDELRRSRLPQQRQRRLEQRQRGDAVDGNVFLDCAEGRGFDGLKVVGDAGVGEDDVEVGDLVGCLEEVDGSEGVGEGFAVDLDGDEGA